MDDAQIEELYEQFLTWLDEQWREPPDPAVADILEEWGPEALDDLDRQFEAIYGESLGDLGYRGQGDHKSIRGTRA